MSGDAHFIRSVCTPLSAHARSMFSNRFRHRHVDLHGRFGIAVWPCGQIASPAGPGEVLPVVRFPNTTSRPHPGFSPESEWLFAGAHFQKRVFSNRTCEFENAIILSLFAGVESLEREMMESFPPVGSFGGGFCPGPDRRSRIMQEKGRNTSWCQFLEDAAS